jgi:hypothetical protein
MQPVRIAAGAASPLDPGIATASDWILDVHPWMDDHERDGKVGVSVGEPEATA